MNTEKKAESANIDNEKEKASDTANIDNAKSDSKEIESDNDELKLKTDEIIANTSNSDSEELEETNTSDNDSDSEELELESDESETETSDSDSEELELESDESEEKTSDSDSEELELESDESEEKPADSDSEELELESDESEAKTSDSDSEELELESGETEAKTSDSDSEELELESGETEALDSGSEYLELESDEISDSDSEELDIPELQIIQQFSKLEQQLIIAIFLSGLSKTQLAKDIYDTQSKEQHQKVTEACSDVQQKMVSNIQEHWDDKTYEQLYKDLQHLLKTTPFYSLPNEEKPQIQEKSNELVIFLHLSKLQLQLIIAIFLNGFSKTQLSKEIFAQDYKVDHHVRVTDMLSALQKRIIELIEKLWNDETYKQMYHTLAEKL